MRVELMALALAMALPLVAGPAIPKDKQAHIAAGVVIGLASATLANHLGMKHPATVGFIVGTTVGIAKELYDRKHPKNHTAEFNDALATSAGASFCFVVRW